MNHHSRIASLLVLLIIAMGGRMSAPAPAATPAAANRAELKRPAAPLEALAKAASGATLAAAETAPRSAARTARCTTDGGRAARTDTRGRDHARTTNRTQRGFALRGAHARHNIPATYGNPPPALRS